MKKSLGSAISIWSRARDVRSKSSVKHLRTAFKSYILPEKGYAFVTQLSAEEFTDFCHELDLLNFNETEILEIFDKAFSSRVDAGKVSVNTKGNYRSALRRFFRWLRSQSWYKETLVLPVPESCPKRVYAIKLPPREYEGPRFYGLKEKDLPEKIRHELDSYEFFWNQDSQITNLDHFVSITEETNSSDTKALRLRKAKDEIHLGVIQVRPTIHKIAKSTLESRRRCVRSFLGWCINIEGYSIDEVSLDWIVRRAFYLDYVDWLIQKRGCGYVAGENLLLVSLSIAKYQTFHNSSKDDWSDIPLVQFIQHKLNEFRELSKQEYVSKQEERWLHKELSHQQAREVVEYLYQFCSPRLSYFSNGVQYTRKRHVSAFVANWQIYLIVKFLVYAPVRQEELRKLMLSTTLRLVQDAQGISRYAVKIKDHKRSTTTGKPRYYPLPRFLTKDIATWIEEIRPLAINTVSTLDGWLSFWEHSPDKLTRLQQKIQLIESTDILDEKSLRILKNNLRGVQGKVNAWSIAKQNAESCDYLFFTLGSTYPAVFCRPWRANTLSSLVTLAVSGATKALYGEAKYLSPHGFRNTGAKHLRKIGRDKDKEAFSALLGHTVEIDDEYANVITNDFELLEDFVDDWWL